MSEKRPCVYILASRREGTLYVDVHVNLGCRASERCSHAIDGFTQRYSVKHLV